jgi:hypothetical protein
MRRPHLFVMVVVALMLLPSSASLARHVQNIGRDSAKAFCSGKSATSDDGAECSFCDPSHCHTIWCDKGTNKCHNLVDMKGNPGGKRAPTTGLEGERAEKSPGTNSALPSTDRGFSGGGHKK